MLPDKEIALCNIIGQLITPALREIQDFAYEYRVRKICRDFYGMSYQNIYYYLQKLCSKRKISTLTCESGYTRRYCAEIDVKSHKRRLNCCIKFVGRENDKYIYRLGIEDLALNVEGRIHQEESRNGNTFIAFYDSELSRYYVIRNSVFVGVIRRESRTTPLLPGSTYGYGTEYSRCLDLFKKHSLSHRILSLVGHRTVTGGD